MNAGILPKRIRFAFPFAILTKPDTVRLVAGEEFRYTLRSPSLDQWLPRFLSHFNSEVEWRLFLDQLPGERQQHALEIITRLYGERVLLEGNGQSPRLPSPLRWVVEGSGKLSERLRAAVPDVSANAALWPCFARTFSITRLPRISIGAAAGPVRQGGFGFRADRWAADTSVRFSGPTPGHVLDA